MQGTSLRALIFLILVLPTFAIDREAFTFTKYELDARIERDQQRLGVRGRLTLRNDSNTPQKIAILRFRRVLIGAQFALTTSNFSSSASLTRQMWTTQAVCRKLSSHFLAS